MPLLGAMGSESWHPVCQSPSADRFSDLIGLSMICSPLGVIAVALLGLLALIVIEKLTSDD